MLSGEGMHEGMHEAEARKRAECTRLNLKVHQPSNSRTSDRYTKTKSVHAGICRAVMFQACCSKLVANTSHAPESYICIWLLLLLLLLLTEQGKSHYAVGGGFV
jgi:hypothetical protein